MPSRKTRVAIIGLGRMGSTIDDEGHTNYPYSIAASTKASPHLELVAGVDIIEEKRTAFTKRWGIEAVYQDFGKMIEATVLESGSMKFSINSFRSASLNTPDASFGSYKQTPISSCSAF